MYCKVARLLQLQYLCFERATAMKNRTARMPVFWRVPGSVVLCLIRRTICFNISDNIYNFSTRKRNETTGQAHENCE
jgi:hypothetical protein